MKEKLQTIQENFEKNVESVYTLMNFDRLILDYSISSITQLVEKLKSHHHIDNPQLTALNTLSNLQKIRKHGSLKRHYMHIFNQCIVLLVSYFGSTIADIFKFCLAERVKEGLTENIAREEIKLSLGELQEYNFNLSDCIGELVVNKKDISFQDMQSISRAFKEYFGFEPQKDKIVNNIIAGQACRHIIVHSGNIANCRLIRQISHAEPRDIKMRIKENELIEFIPDEIRIVGDSMKTYVSRIIEELLNINEY